MAQDQFEAWNRIASSFDATRQRTWAHVDAFLDGLPEGARVLDVMCGNGRHLRPGSVGLDWSQGLVEAANQNASAVRGDATRLPFARASFDAATYVAGLHGIPSRDGRMKSLIELRRVIGPGGTAQITVWSRHAPRFEKLDLAPGPQDVMIPWKRDGHEVERFYHLYDAASFEQDLTAAGWHVTSLEGVAIAADSPDNLVAVVN